MLEGATTRGRVLVIDDQPAIRELLGAILDAAGYDVLTAETGGEGLKLEADAGPQLIIVDRQMPDMDGFQVAAELCRRGSRAAIAIMSGDAAARQRIQEVGVQAFLAKPFNARDVLELVRKCLPAR